MDLLRIESSVAPNAVVVLTATGEVDISTIEFLAEHARHALGLVAVPRAVVIDLAGVRFLSAAGVGVLVVAHRRCARRGVPFLVAAPNRCVLRTLEACDALSVLHVVATVGARAGTTCPRDGTGAGDRATTAAAGQRAVRR
jgi:anti-sigma B factor antagonist